MSVSCYLNEFRPLARTPHGRAAIEQHRLPLFIDASCHREPDLESKFPSITALCRGGFFAPRLLEGDVVAYMTAQFAYPPETRPTRRLVGVLRIHKSWRSAEGQSGIQAHELAAVWYRQQGLTLPSNCMVEGNKPMPLDKTDRYMSNLRLWDRHYRNVAEEHGVFHACESIFCEVNDPPRLTNQQLVEWFGTIPDTRALPALPPEKFLKMLRWLAGQTSDTASRHGLEALCQSLQPPSLEGKIMQKASVTPLRADEIVRRIAKGACECICRRVIRAYRRMPPILCGDDSPLASIWEDICVQEQQQERSVAWEESYEASLLGFLEGEVDELDDATRWAIWHITDAALDWRVDETQPPEKWSGEDLARFLLDRYVLPAAENYSNARIRRFIEQTGQED